MAEGILFSAAELIIETLGSAAVKEIALLCGFDDEIDKLKTTLSTIKAVLLDAEKKRAHNNQVKHWLERLEDVVSEADDLLDEVATEGLLHQTTTFSRNKVVKKVRAFFSSSNQLVFRHKMAQNIKRVRETLDQIALDSQRFRLEVSSEETRFVGRVRDWETHSFVVEEDVVGRGDDKMAVLELLLSPQTTTKRDEKVLSVLPIVGMGGLGKTTLSQLVFNDERVQRHFELRIWVRVSDNFDERLLIEKIVESVTEMRANECTMEKLQKTLQEKLNKKRYLLVLDDVWNENYEKWQGLKRVLRNCGDHESRILVTTRSTMVAKIMGTLKPYHLGILDLDKSWSLFKKIAFEHEDEPTNPEIAGIAREIAKKCGGVPLAINMIASLLYFRGQEVEYWRYFQRELSNVIPQEENNILKTLKLSYDYLPPHLKHCFAFCALFRKDQEIDVRTLVFLWIAQGFVKSSGQNESLEEIGYEYFMELFWRSFFQEVERDDMSNNLKTCKMHDLVHDLAVQVAGKQYAASTYSEEQRHIHAKVRHLSLSSYEGPSSFLDAKRLRTILFPTRASWKAKGITGEAICEEIFSNFKLLRMLDLRNFGIETVPNSIGKLKHLRYLDLSKNYKIETLPASISKLVNLQTLRLNECSKLRELPSDISSLVNLRHLEFYSWKSNVSHMPRGLSQLTNLQTLSSFVLSEDSALMPCGTKLDELMPLNNLRGKLEIKGLRSGTKTEAANLKEKANLRSLYFEWSRFESYNCSNHGREIEALEGLEPHRNLKELSIVKYDGLELSNWLLSLTNLVHFRLDKCSKCEKLPSLDQLRFLKRMRIDRCHELKYIATNVGHHRLSPTSPPIPTLPSLEELELRELYEFKGWYGKQEIEEAEFCPSYFPSLTKLTVQNCLELTLMPLFPNVKKLQLSDANEKPFEQTVSLSATSRPQISSSSSSSSSQPSFSPLSQVKHLIIHFSSAAALQHFPQWMNGLSSLESLEIYRSRDLYLSPSFEFHAPRLVWKIDGCDRTTSDDQNWPAWECFTRLRHLYCQGLPTLNHLFPAIKCLTSLEKLQIQDCDDLEFESLDDNFRGQFTCEALTRLRTLVFFMVSEPRTLPGWLRRVTSLEELQLGHCRNLASIPDWIFELDSLRQLEIIDCPAIESLPGSISRTTSLRSLRIQGCPALLERCRNPTGEDWPKIKHIAELKLKFS